MRIPRGTRRHVAVLAVALALLFGAVAAAGATAAAPADSYTARLSGATEVPPRTTPGGGEAAIQISPDGQSLSYTVTVRDITNVTMGHIHIGAVGTNGDIVLPLVPAAAPGGGPRNGVIGQGTLTAAQLVGPLQGKPLGDLIAQLDAGNAYVNIHTATGASPATLAAGDLPPGEIRGQLVRSTVPAAAATATRSAGATATAPAAASTATRSVAVAATATRSVGATVTAPPSPSPTVAPVGMPSSGGGYGAQQAWQPWLAALAALLTLGLAGLLRYRRLQRGEGQP
jgi:hypothetical protein